MNSIIFKINCGFSYEYDKDTLHNEISKYGFIEYIDKSKIDGYYIYKLYRQDISERRVNKMNNILKRMGKELVLPILNKDIATDLDAEKFLDKYLQYIQIISLLEDHIPNFYSDRYTIK